MYRSSFRAEITVFLSMVLLSVLGLIGVMLEAARTEGARCYLQIAANSSVDSLFSQYQKELWEQYHLFGLEYGSETEEARQLQGYLDQYLAVDNWYPMGVETVEIEQLTRLTDGGGIYLEQEILAYMKYGVWSQLEIMPEQGEQLWKQIKEAKGVQELSGSYIEQNKEAWKLEQALDHIYQCLKKKQEYHSQGRESLQAMNSSGLKRQAYGLEKELKKLPGLVGAYQKQADRLKEKLADMESHDLERQEEISGEISRYLSGVREQYKSYIAQDGGRRQEIEALIKLGEENQMVVASVKEKINQIEEYLESREDEAEDGEGEYIRGLWDEAEESWQKFGNSSLASSGTKDEEKKGWLDRIRKMTDVGLLNLVVPEDMEISQAVLDLEDAPSKSGEMTGETDHKNLLTRVLVNEYCTMHFSSFTDHEETSEVSYEMEYLLGGEGSDRENLESTLGKLLAVREGLNLIHILMDSQKREEARSLAFAITGALGLVPLVEITAFFIMGIWALGESVADIKAILSGNNVPLLKTKEDWNLDLEQLLEMGKEQLKPDGKHSEKGISYEGYLKLLLLLERSEKKYVRIMDVIQMNLKRKQENFRMERCAWFMDIKVMASGKHVFFALPFVESLTGGGLGYQIQVRTNKAY